jgi:hypothetical protein
MAAGRKSKLTKQRIDKIAGLIREGNYAKTACAASGITESAYYLWLKEGRAALAKEEPLNAREKLAAQLVEAIEAAEAEAEARAVQVIQGATMDHWQAAAWYLERKHADRWGRKDAHKVEAQVKSDVTVTEKTREELAAELQALDPVEE